MPEAHAEKERRSPLPSAGDILFAGIFCLLLFLLPNYLYGDGCTGWHLVTGNFILDQYRIPATDIISASLPHQPWVPYEWLFDLIAATLVKFGGLNLLAVASASAIGLLFLLLYRDCRNTGCHFIVCLIICLIGCFASSVHWLARPHLFTFFGLYFYSRWLNAYRRNEMTRRNLLIRLALTMVIWCNAHPAFLVGFALIGIYLAAACIEAWTGMSRPAGGRTQKEVVATFCLALLVALASSLVNPFGIGLYQYIFHYLQHSFVLANTVEFMPPPFGQKLHAICLEGLFAACLIGLAVNTGRSGPGFSLTSILLLLCFGHEALISQRNEPLFVIVSLPIIAQLFAGSCLTNTHAEPPPGRWRNIVFKLREMGTGFDENEAACRLHLMPALLVVAMTITSLAGGNNVLNSQFADTEFPTDTLAVLAGKKLDPAHGLNYDNWGGYIAYKTGRGVFIDDRLDYYGEERFREYGQVTQLKPGWEGVLDKDGIYWALFPKQSALAAQLHQTPGWHLAASDKAADLFIKDAPKP